MRRSVTVGVIFFGTLSGAGAALAQDPPKSEVSSLDSLLNTKISSAAKYEQTIREVAGAVTIVTSEEIERYGYRKLSDVLAAARGFYVSDDRNYTYVGVRGFGRPTDYNNRIVLLVDGYVANDGIWGMAPVGNELGIDLSAVERVEIVRGPSSALYGTGAMFGVINLVTKRGGAGPRYEVTGRGGSYGQWGSSAHLGQKFSDGTDLFVSAHWDDSDGQSLYYPEYDSPTTNRGIASHVDAERSYGFLASARRGGLGLQARFSSRRKLIPTGAFGTLFGDPRNRTTDRYGSLQATYDVSLGATKLVRTRAYAGSYSYEGDYASTGTINREGATDHHVGAETALQWDLSSANRLTIGAEVKRHLKAEYFYPRSGPREYDLSTPFTVLSAYVQHEYQITPNLALLGGFRFDRYSHTGNAAAPRAAAVFSPTQGTTVKLLYGRAYRAPTLSESAPTSDYYVHNPDLEPERLSTVEAIYQQRVGGRVLATIAAFSTKVNGLIDQVDVAGDSATFRNLGRVEASGIEVGIDARFGARVAGYGSYTHQRAIDQTADRPMTNSPRHLVKSGLTIAASRGLRSAVEVRYESSRLTMQGTRTRPFAVTNLNFIYTPSLGRSTGLLRGLGQFDLAVKINNLFGADYAVPAGVEHLQSTIPQDGRNLLAEVKVRF